jgi:3',5'-cyclic AMP phosphodiesterase CpdA
LRRSLVLVVATLLITSLVAPTVGAQAVTPEPGDPCGPTTIDATLQLAADGTLECGPGQPVVVREELATAGVDRAALRESLSSFFAIADVQLADEESPARGEGSDPCYPSPGISSSAFRPHETMVPHLMNAHIRAANEIAATGSPNLGSDFDFLIGLGDLADNQQYNEIRWIIDILDGAKLVDPDTGDDPVLGGEGYDGLQTEDPAGAGGRTPQVVSPDLPSEGVLELANEPFWVTGIRQANDSEAEQLPWYSLPGNHDVKVQGTLPDELSGTDHNEMKLWRALYRSYYIGNAKAVLQDIPPDRKQKLCEAMETQDEALFMEAMTEILSDPQGTSRGKVIPSDQARMPLYRTDEIKQLGDEEACLAVATGRPLAEEICRSSWVEQHFDTTGTPVGHGYQDSATSNRCRDTSGQLLARACYSFTDGPFHYIGLDSNPPEGAETGNIDPEQVEWLERELVANSTTYFDASGAPVDNPEGEDRMIVVFAHHPSDSMRNEFAPTSPGIEGEEFRQLLLRFPNVILNANGHTHQNRIWARSNEALGTGYWEVNTSAIADFPTQSRTIEIADNNDGTLSIFATVFDALVGPDAGEISWTDDDPTSEIALSEGEATRDINEDWLASWGREVMFYDPQTDLNKMGAPEDRNVELLLPAPEWLDGAEATQLTYTGETSERVGKTLDASAVLTTDSGQPLSGLPVTFTRDGQSVVAVTDSAGTASAALKVNGPPSGDKPVVVTFEGSGNYLPVSITVPFTSYSSPQRQRSLGSNQAI